MGGFPLFLLCGHYPSLLGILFYFVLCIFFNVYCSVRSVITFTLCSMLFIGSIIYTSTCHLQNCIVFISLLIHGPVVMGCVHG
jgi:hypothetical protein